MQLGKSEALKTPNGNSYVWRYMSMKKFTRLIDDQALYFCNAKRLSDQYEVTIPDSTLQSWRQQLVDSGLRADEIEPVLTQRLQQFVATREHTLINCWSLTPHESYALWKIYLGNQPEGVAIRTTVARLKGALLMDTATASEPVYIGQVRYRNYLNPLNLNPFDIITTKKTFYDFERELRLFVLNQTASAAPGKPGLAGMNLSVDLKRLVQAVYLSPFAGPGIGAEVEALLASRGLSKGCVKASEIRDL
ncbi:MAG TPA: hypothetical protein VIF60_23815 [Burkholderiaceae bacterium]